MSSVDLFMNFFSHYTKISITTQYFQRDKTNVPFEKIMLILKKAKKKNKNIGSKY